MNPKFSPPTPSRLLHRPAMLRAFNATMAVLMVGSLLPAFL